MSATVTYDHLNKKETAYIISEMPLYGVERMMGESSALPNVWDKVIEFQLYDDDDELYYSGLLHDDDDCLNQSAVLRWGETMGGCTLIKVKRDGEWVVEIG